MRSIKNKLLFSLILFFISINVPVVKAQITPVPTNQALTLEQCIDYALKNNIQIKQSELTTDISQINLIQSEANLLPSLNGNASHSYNIGRTVDRFTNQFADAEVLSQNFSLSTDVTIFGGLQSINTIQQNKF
ncbi:MAG: TolC family protein, partial [Bacteroidia bacterium]